MESNLREAEDELIKVLAVRTRKEAKQMALRNSISATKSHRLQAVSKDNAGQITEDKSNINDAISWYNQALGFHVEAGHGVKFTFTNIDAKRPTREFSITVHYGNDIYTLLGCNSQLDDMDERVQELNKTNDLFGFVRLMSDKFQKATIYAANTFRKSATRN